MPRAAARPAGALFREDFCSANRLWRLDAVKPVLPASRVICPITRGSAKVSNDVAEERLMPANDAIQSVTGLIRPPKAPSSIDRPAVVKPTSPFGDVTALETLAY